MNKQIPRKKKLTPRQKEILACILQGMSNKEISEKLNITYGSAKLMAHQTIKSLGYSSRYEALAKIFAKDQGL